MIQGSHPVGSQAVGGAGGGHRSSSGLACRKGHSPDFGGNSERYRQAICTATDMDLQPSPQGSLVKKPRQTQGV